MKRLAGIVLWKYADDVPVERLYRHYRIAYRIVWLWMGSSVLMCSTLAEFLVSPDGLLREISLIIGMFFVVGALILTLPAIVCCAWCGEIEATLRHRGCAPPHEDPVGLRVGYAAMKMCFWIAVVMLIASLAR